MKAAQKNNIPDGKINVCPKEFASEDIALRYLAKILVQAYFDHNSHERNKINKKKSGHLLPSIN